MAGGKGAAVVAAGGGAEGACVLMAGGVAGVADAVEAPGWYTRGASYSGGGVPGGMGPVALGGAEEQAARANKNAGKTRTTMRFTSSFQWEVKGRFRARAVPVWHPLSVL